MKRSASDSTVSLRSLVASHADTTNVDGLQAVSLTTLIDTVMRTVKDVIPIKNAWSGRDKMVDAFAECARLRDDASLEATAIASISHGQRCGRRTTSVYTLREIADFLWHFVASRVHAHLMRAVATNAANANAYSRKDRPNPTSHWPHSSEEMQAAGRLICSGLSVDGDAFMRECSIEDCADTVAMLCDVAFGFAVDALVVRDHIAPIFIDMFEPSPFLAHTVARCDIMKEIIGATLSDELRVFVHRCAFKLPLRPKAAAFTANLVGEVVQSRAKITKLKSAIVAGDLSSASTGSIDGTSFVRCGMNAQAVATRCMRGSGKNSARMGLRLNVLEFTFNVNTAFKHVPLTLAEAANVVHFARTGRDAPLSQHAAVTVEYLLHESTTRRDTNTMDSAIDSYTKADVMKAW